MRKRNIYLGAIFFNLIFTSSIFSKDLTQAYSFTGRLNIKTFPVQLIIEEGTQNEEIVFLKNLSADDTFKMANLTVTVKGKFEPYKKSYILNVSSIYRKK